MHRVAGVCLLTLVFQLTVLPGRMTIEFNVSVSLIFFIGKIKKENALIVAILRPKMHNILTNTTSLSI